MKIRLFLPVLSAAFLASGSAPAQHDWEIVIEPAAPDSPDFATTIDPLKPGEYSVILWTNWGGLGHPIVAERSFVVSEAAPAEALLDGGINGFYYNPDADGHYVYILQTDFPTLITWNTFDAEGNQAWIFGTGKLENGKAVVADAHVNHSDRYSTDGTLEGLRVQAGQQESAAHIPVSFQAASSAVAMCAGIRRGVAKGLAVSNATPWLSPSGPHNRQLPLHPAR